MAASGNVHIPVMMREVLFYLEVKPGQTLVDGTVGAGGHAAELLRAAPGGKVIGIDRDAEILKLAEATLKEAAAESNASFELHQADFSQVGELLAEPVDGFLLDLGVSSLQLDRPERGFSFMAEGPLDMRMDPTRGESAAEALRRMSETELETVIREYGEERFARRVAGAIKQALRRSKIRTTGELADIVHRAVPGRRGKIDSATRTFQALRIYVNRELDELESVLQDLPGLLKPGGRAAVISYHSLEDRIVKQTFRKLALAGHIEILTRKPVSPQQEEVVHNRRSRSAKLRAVQRL